MEKADIIKMVISVVIIIVLAIFIVNINKVITPKVPKIVEEQTVPTLNEPKSDTAVTGGIVTEENVEDYGQCFSKYGKSANTVVFVHSNYCPHCRNMMPIVEELEKEGYKFYWAESSDNEAIEIVNNCFNNLLTGYVPQFICPKTGKEQTGGMGKADLKEFADNCR